MSNFNHINLGQLIMFVSVAMVFIAYLYAVYRFLRWIATSLPAKVASADRHTTAKSLGIILPLIFFPSLAIFAWGIARDLIDTFSQLITGVWATGLNCISPSNQTCISKAGETLNQNIKHLLAALRLEAFPVADFVWFLLAVAIATQLAMIVCHPRTMVGLRKLARSTRSRVSSFPISIWQQLAFTALVVFSFYLGLCALLAIPVFQDQISSQQLGIDALGKALDSNITPAAEFDKVYPLSPVEFPQPNSPGFNDRWTVLVAAWSGVRSHAANEPTSWRRQAINAFSAGLDAGMGKQQASEYYYNLLLWHQRMTQGAVNTASQCLNGIRDFGRSTAHFAESVLLLSKKIPDDSTAQTIAENISGISRVSDAYYQAIAFCTLSRENQDPPEKPSKSNSFGPVGHWTRWLLDTGQMPVVIIVGLVGFSLLGATVSRAVRAKAENSPAGLAFEDLLTVIAGGMTAAVVVFLAAYGGLAVLGNSTGDPNPYVLFVTCLIGAVYSEDVWSWARNRLSAVQSEPNSSSRQESEETIVSSPPGDGSPPPATAAEAPTGSTTTEMQTTTFTPGSTTTTNPISSAP